MVPQGLTAIAVLPLSVTADQCGQQTAFPWLEVQDELELLKQDIDRVLLSQHNFGHHMNHCFQVGVGGGCCRWAALLSARTFVWLVLLVFDAETAELSRGEQVAPDRTRLVKSVSH